MAATTISRTAYNNLTDDDGTGTTGSVWDKADVDDILDAVDGLFSATTGITLNQGAGDAAILSLESSDVVHGMTSLANTTNVFGELKKSRGDEGGLKVAGYDDASANSALLLQGYQGAAATTTKSTSGFGVVRINSAVKSAATATAVGADGNLLSVENDGTVRFIFDAEGDLHYDSSAVSFDEWDDLMLARAFDLQMATRGVVRTAFDEFVSYRREDLIRAGIVSEDGMVNLTRHTQLLNGALWQLFTRFKCLEQRVDGLLPA